MGRDGGFIRSCQEAGLILRTSASSTSNGCGPEVPKLSRDAQLTQTATTRRERSSAWTSANAWAPYTRAGARATDVRADEPTRPLPAHRRKGRQGYPIRAR